MRNAGTPGFSTEPHGRSTRNTWNGSPQRELTTNTLSGKLGADQPARCGTGRPPGATAGPHPRPSSSATTISGDHAPPTTPSRTLIMLKSMALGHSHPATRDEDMAIIAADDYQT